MYTEIARKYNNVFFSATIRYMESALVWAGRQYTFKTLDTGNKHKTKYPPKIKHTYIPLISISNWQKLNYSNCEWFCITFIPGYSAVVVL